MVDEVADGHTASGNEIFSDVTTLIRLLLESLMKTVSPVTNIPLALICALLAAPPSPKKPAAAVPANVEIRPVWLLMTLILAALSKT